MDGQLLSRVIKLSEKTGDRVIVVSPQTDKAFVVLPFEAYEQLTSSGSATTAGQEIGLQSLETPLEEMSRQALVDKINQEISAWNIAQQSQKEIDDVTPMDILDDEANEEQYYLEPIE